MALQSGSPAPPLSPQVVSSAFVQQYYEILHQTPEQVHRFYHDSSILGRPNSDGLMTSVTTMEAINEKIMSLDFKNCFTEIETADAQLSYNNGVLIIVTGSLTGTDNFPRKFTQSFFLAPQENGGYFVLNDVFRFVTGTQLSETTPTVVNDVNGSNPKAPLTSDPEPASLEEHHVTGLPAAASEGDAENEEVIDPSPSENGGSGVEDDIALEPISSVSQEETEHNSEAVASAAQKDVPKKSYASIVKVMKGSPSLPAAVHGPTPKVKQVAERTEKPSPMPAKPAHAAEASSVPSSNSMSENNSCDAQGHSIYIRNLPLNVTAEEVKEEFKKFGAIKPGGVQVRSHKVERFCFGFVEFESLKSMQDAIEASPISFGGRQVFAEEKRTTTRVINGVVTRADNGNGGGGGRFPYGRGGFRSDGGFRGRGSFGNYPGYRIEFRSHIENPGRGRGAQSRSVDGYQQQQRVFQNGNGRFGRLNGPRPTVVSS